MRLGRLGKGLEHTPPYTPRSLDLFLEMLGSQEQV